MTLSLLLQPVFFTPDEDLINKILLNYIKSMLTLEITIPQLQQSLQTFCCLLVYLGNNDIHVYAALSNL